MIRLAITVLSVSLLAGAGCPETGPSNLSEQRSGDTTGRATPGAGAPDGETTPGAEGSTTGGGETPGAGSAGSAQAGGGGAGAAGTGAGNTAGGASQTGTGGQAGGGQTGGGQTGGGTGETGGGGGQNGGGVSIAGAEELRYLEALTVGARRTCDSVRKHVVPCVTYPLLIGQMFTGQLTFAGTVYLQAAQNEAIENYQPSPPDRLVVVDAFGRIKAEYRYSAFDGDTTDVASLTANHSVTVAISDATAAVQLESVAYGPQGHRRHYRGQVTLGLGPIESDIVEGAGAYINPAAPQWDGGQGVYDGRVSLTGTVSAAGQTVQVLETYKFNFVNQARDVQIMLASTGARGGAQYRAENVYLRGTYRGNAPVQPDYWFGQGALVRDGAAIGQFLVTTDLRMLLQLVDGTTWLMWAPE